MERGNVLETKYKRHRGLKLDLVVFAAGNTDRTIPPELLSRFNTKLYFPPYSFEEFIRIRLQGVSVGTREYSIGLG